MSTTVYLAVHVKRVSDFDGQTKLPPSHGRSDTWNDVRLGANLTVSEKTKNKNT
jgi:hypothetical protein